MPQVFHVAVGFELASYGHPTIETFGPELASFINTQLIAYAKDHHAIVGMLDINVKEIKGDYPTESKQ